MISKNQIKAVHALELKKNRRLQRLFVAEGPKVVGDLLAAGYQPEVLYSTAERQHAQQVTEDELQRISFLQHPQEVVGVFHMPDEQPWVMDSNELALALDGIQDPGNLGTIIRIADWFGINTIYCSTDTADVYNPKVVQATMGSLAHVSVRYGDLAKLLQTVSCPIYGTLLDGENIYEKTLTRNGIIVMGNEGNGISEPIRALITQRLLIPNFNTDTCTAESLNVAIATAITCSEFKRR